ncbi:hypothetical protein HPB50_015274 [Hyalomma asiaticum]|uniref:Uncharacterized protein n=1 Tax=Hyalomma asiaticum TaxID=266040 RepID=A0ACB7RI90_HYAAI|nr:hypothetical protein HPB50_015274 [Hyalomma asiaticum]
MYDGAASRCWCESPAGGCCARCLSRMIVWACRLLPKSRRPGVGWRHCRTIKGVAPRTSERGLHAEVGSLLGRRRRGRSAALDGRRRVV